MMRNPKENTGLLPVSLTSTGENVLKENCFPPLQLPDQQEKVYLQYIQDNQALLTTET